MINKLENKLLAAFFVFVLIAIISIYRTITFIKISNWPRRVNLINIDGCKVVESSIIVILGDKLRVFNNDSLGHTYSAFGETIHVPAYEEGILQLNHNRPIFGKLGCDKLEILDINLLKKERIILL